MARQAHVRGIKGSIRKPGQGSTGSVVVGIHRLLPAIIESAHRGPDGARTTMATVAESGDESITFERRAAV